MPKSVTLVFPGQGSQYVGMGKNLENKDRYFEADKILKYKLSDFCFNGPESDLILTANAQPAIITHSIALYDLIAPILKKKNVHIDQVLGHSVGEYAALVAAGALSFEDAVMSVHLRGKYMQEAVPAGKGKMIALMKLSEEIVREACLAASDKTSKVMPANFNEPNQIVISGDAEACDRAVQFLEKHSTERFRAIPLKVSAPFHSTLMAPAAEKLAAALNHVTFNPLVTPYVANINATKYGVGTQGEIVRENLISQVVGSVLWTQSIESLPAETICLEVGPGKVLSGLISKIRPEIKTFSLDHSAINEIEEVLS